MSPSLPRRPTRHGLVAIVFPDVCKTPAPGGPIPVPYPNSGAAPGQAQQRFARHIKNPAAAGAADAGSHNGNNPAGAGQQKQALEQWFIRTGSRPGAPSRRY